jgi:hypothetical protein
MDGVYSFGDFLNRGNSNKPIVENKPEIKQEVKQDLITEKKLIEEPIEVKEHFIEREVIEESADDDYYKLYQDKEEEFVCDIQIEGSSQEESFARIIIESKDWSLIFNGDIRNGKCTVPIKKLGIFKEGEIGNIKLEVVAEGNLFVPWESQFKVKLSKKVTVKLNENKQVKKPITNKVGVKVNVK